MMPKRSVPTLTASGDRPQNQAVTGPCHIPRQTASVPPWLRRRPVYKYAMPKSSRTDFPTPTLITTTADLVATCQRLRVGDFVTVDTEFMR